jgi:hypothetical protein
MTAPANATKLWLLARIWRVGLALCAMRGAHALDDLAVRLLSEDLRRKS